MSRRVIWRGETEQMHPVLGLLRPGQPVQGEVAAELLDALAQDASGLFEIVDEAERAAPVAPPSSSPTRRVDHDQPRRGGGPRHGIIIADGDRAAEGEE